MLVTLRQKRRGEIVEHLGEDQRGARHIARQRQRKDDTREQRETTRAEVLRRLLHRRIDVGERGREVEQDEREIVQRLDEDDAVQSFHERDAEAEPVVEQEIDRAVAPVDELHRHRADERRHHQRHDAERMDQRRAAEAETRQDGRERHRDQARQHDRHHTHIDRIPERLAQQPGREEIAEMDEGEAVRPGEGDDDHPQQRNDQERDQEERDRGQHDDLRRARPEAGGERPAAVGDIVAREDTGGDDNGRIGLRKLASCGRSLPGW